LFIPKKNGKEEDMAANMKFWCGGCGRKIFSKENLKNKKRVPCPHCRRENLVEKKNGKVKVG
jgi:DNA-directed RNA polymerase subunit RPC12/RpoP